MSKLTILDKSAVIRNETQPLANTRGRVADVLDDIANTFVDQDDLNAEATARANGDQTNANAIADAIADEATARAQGDAMKLDKPNSDGSYYIAKTTVAGIPYYQYRVIDLSSGQIPVSRGSYIGASLLYESVSGRIGLDTQAPSEKFEVYNGRVKADGFILTSSTTAPLPREIKFKGGNFVGAKDDGIERKFLMGGDLDTELTTKLDKGTYAGTAQDLYDRFEGKIDAGYNCIPKVGNGASGKVLVDSAVSEIKGKIGIGLGGEASEKLEVNGNIKATQIKDQYGTLKSQRTITITGNTTLSENHNGAILNVTNACNITVPTGLDANFNCVIFAKGAIIVTFVNSGVTIYAPSGLLLKQDKMASLICTSTNNFNLTGELATS